jgi:hypothetical protein
LIFFHGLTSNIFSQEAEDWNQSKSTHFVIYYRNAPGDFIPRLSEQAEGYYDSIADELGFRRFDFWLWDNRASIFVYDNADAFKAATGQPEWAMGDALPKQKSIRTFVDAKSFFESTLPHEMSHIIFREFVGFNNPAVPLWLDEGVASYYQKSKYYGVNQMLKSAAEKNMLMGIEELSSFKDITLESKDRAKIFYAQSFSIVDFLFRSFGRDAFVLFCQHLRDDQDINRALARAYSLDGTKELDSAWKKEIISE